MRREGCQLQQPFTPEELQRAIKTVKKGKSAGPNGIPPDSLHHLPPRILRQLLQILNSSWMTQWCPQAWRTATIVPILKKEKDPELISSYRPIALTSSLSKLMERLIVNRLLGGWSNTSC